MNKLRWNKLAFNLAAAVIGLTVAAQQAGAAVSYTGASYSQNFDSLPNTGATNPWTNDSTLPGWSLFKRANPSANGGAPPYVTAPIASIAAGAGTSTTGAIYSFGVADSTDRAFGGIASGNSTYWGDGATNNGPFTTTPAGWIALALTNSTGSSVDSFNIAFDGEQWRNGGNVSLAAQNMVMEYGVGADFDSVTWTTPGGTFDFVSPITAATNSALNGNDPANRVAGLGGAVTGITWGVGETLWVRWVELNDTGNDHGLAIDNLVFSTGGATPTVDADFNNDNVVDGNDFLIWQRGRGIGSTNATGDADGNGVVDAADLTAWKNTFGGPPAVGAITAVPEPASLALCGLAFAAAAVSRRRAK